MARHGELEWHAQCLNQRNNSMAPAYQGASIADLYAQRRVRERIKERQARLATCGLLPMLLVYCIHLAW
jgi:hypothetical protein